MKKKNGYQAAGVLNIVCGALILMPILMLTGITLLLTFLGVQAESGMLAWIFALLSGIMMGIFVPVLIVCCLFVFTGMAMISECRKGAGIKILTVFNMIVKILIGMACLTSGLVLFIVLLVISVVLDIRALSSEEKIA